MATADQVKALIGLHYSNESERFTTIALQIAAHEAQQGHGNLAVEIRNIIDKAQKNKDKVIKLIPKDIQGLVIAEEPSVLRSALVLSYELSQRIDRIIKEYKRRELLSQYGLSHRRKIMFVGPPGTGKTMTASMLSYELRLPLYIVQMDRIVTKYMGETAAKLRQIFDLVKSQKGVFFFDEFDSIGAERSRDNEVGEMRRVLSSFLQFIEQNNSDSLILVATNNHEILDKALFRRFNDILFFEKPDDEAREKLLRNILSSYTSDEFDYKYFVKISQGLSHAEISDACLDSIKDIVLNDKKLIDKDVLKDSINDKHYALKGAEYSG